MLVPVNPPPDCDVLVSNPPFADALTYLDHAWALGFRLVVLLLEPSFLHSADRFERLHHAAICAASIRSRSDCLVQRMVQRPC